MVWLAPNIFGMLAQDIEFLCIYFIDSSEARRRQKLERTHQMPRAPKIRALRGHSKRNNKI